MEKRVISTQLQEEDYKIESSLRPQRLEDYIGQEKIKSNMKVYIEAAKARQESLDHVLFYGPPGLGKTTLAGIIANEMGTHLKVTSGPAIAKPGEMAAILNNLAEGDILFVDEIHRLNRQVEEVLYPAMEDYVIDVMIGKGESARSIRLNLPKFTLVGATTRAGMLSAPLRDRFGVVSHMEYYTVEELRTIILQSAQVLDVEIDEKGERRFSFSRKMSADTQLCESELDWELLKKCKIFHFGSLSLADEPARTATIAAVKAAKAAGAVISYDPNYRASLWRNEKSAVEQMKSVIPFVDMMKVSEEELVLLTEMEDYHQAAAQILAWGPKLLAVTLGSEGVLIAMAQEQEKIAGFKVQVVDTTGAGDSFWGGLLSEYLRKSKNLQELTWDEVKSCAIYGNATAALCVQKRGGIPAVPQKGEVELFIKTRDK